MRTRGDTHRLGRGTISFRITKITGCGFELRDAFCRTRSGWVEHFHDAALVRHHENISVRAIQGAQTAADAVIFDHDLQMFAAMNRIDRTTRHAMRIGAGAT